MIIFNRPLPQTVLTGRAEVAKLVDALDLGSSVERRASSSLALGTKYRSGRQNSLPDLSLYVTIRDHAGFDIQYFIRYSE